ncbi:MAG TPA: helix-turn-helix domain-containing protein [Solirubrobacteraceae bacterium]
MAMHLHERIADLASQVDEHALRSHTEASCTANIDQICRMLASGAPAEDLVAPEPALDYARAIVQRRLPLPVLLRAYRVGHGYFWNIASGVLSEQLEERSRTAALDAASNFMFEYIDVMSDALVGEYQVERDRWVRTAAAIRAETVREILDGHYEHERAASSRLGYELRRTHVALILAGEAESQTRPGAAGLEHQATEAAAVLGCADPLLIPAGAAVLWAWCGTFKPPTPAALAKLERYQPPAGVRMAVGRPAFGIDGFRVTHVEAAHASRFWDLGAPHGTTSYSSVEVISLLASDLPRARRFVGGALGALAEQSDAAAGLRSTLLCFLAHGCSHVQAAHELQMHQNTVYNRVRRAEELLGGPVTERRVELHTALMLAQTLGPEVLTH